MDSYVNHHDHDIEHFHHPQISTLCRSLHPWSWNSGSVFITVFFSLEFHIHEFIQYIVYLHLFFFTKHNAVETYWYYCVYQQLLLFYCWEVSLVWMRSWFIYSPVHRHWAISSLGGEKTMRSMFIQIFGWTYF